ncbi:Processing alpha glucosidase I [Coemansia sp. RSA 2531]|nr:Processing alpha glucosidase I [Coemansia sp. RSA 2531]
MIVHGEFAFDVIYECTDKTSCTDIGFHQLVLWQWDSDLSLEIVHSWFGTMDGNGWMAREQILGDEARSKFQVQYLDFANPPTILLAVEAMAKQLLARRMARSMDDVLQAGGAVEEGVCDEQCLLQSKLDSLVPYTSRLLGFFQKSQAGDSVDGSMSPSKAGYRWRGRTENHTLTSGLDDYPRASVPSTGELHIDLYL